MAQQLLHNLRILSIRIQQCPKSVPERVIRNVLVQRLGSWRVIEIIDTVTRVDGGQLLPTVSDVQHFRSRTARDKEEAGVWVDGYPMRTIFATG